MIDMTYLLAIQSQICASYIEIADESEGRTIIFATGNRGKIIETRNIFEPLEINFKYEMIDLPEYQGERDFICTEKCKLASCKLQIPVIIEDTSLHFDALHGLPGPYIKWFYEKLGSDGLYKLLSGFEDKSATAVTVIGYWEGPGHEEIKLFHGETKGSIVKPRGYHGFGWDSCFLPENMEKTYAEMKLEDKNEISHRRKALDKLKIYLTETLTKAGIKTVRYI